MRTKVAQVRDAVQLSMMGAYSTSWPFSIAQMVPTGEVQHWWTLDCCQPHGVGKKVGVEE